MTKRKGRVWVTALTCIAAGAIGGCPRIRVPVPVDLNGALGAVFLVEAGAPAERAFGLTFENPLTIGQGTFQIDASDIDVIVALGGSGKGTVSFQTGDNTVIVTGRVAAAGQEDTVCDSADEYGPFTVELNDDNEPVSVSPSSITLSENTIAVLNAGALTLCLEVEASFSGTVTVHTVILNVGP